MAEQGLPSIAAYPLPGSDELPASRVGWRPDRERSALLVHDMQNYFIRPYPADQSPMKDVIENIAALANDCRSAGIPVIYSGQRGDQDPRDRGLQCDLWGPGMTSAPEHQDFVPAVAPQASDLTIIKHRYSAFQRSNLESLLRARGRSQLLVCGVYAQLGCLLTAAEAFQRDFEPFLIIDAIADFTRERHDFATRYVAESCGVVISTATARKSLC